MTINWQAVGHAAVGILLTASQAVAMVYPQDANACHVLALAVTQLGVYLGVWQIQQVASMRKRLCTNCGKPPFEAAPLSSEPKGA
jgi:hypothetical protein